jgi:transglutaminase-like putative cysteine protease
VVLLTLFALLHWAERAGAANWRPVTAEDLKLTAAAIGDPEADAAILFREGELNDNTSEGTNLKIYIRIKIFNERGRRFVDVQLPYRTELGRITDVHARTIRPDGSPVEVEGRDIFDRLLMKTSHGVWRAKVFSMPAVEAGSIIEYRYRQTYPQGFKYFALDLQSELFTRELSYRIQPQAASRLDVRWAAFNTGDDKRFVPVWDGTYNIKAENIPPFRREPLMPPELTIKMWGWLYYSDETETKPDKYWRTYAERMHDRAGDETKPTQAIRRVVESITSPSNSPQDKITRIYNYVQTEIRNAGFRDEREPDDSTAPSAAPERNRSADETIRRRYGTPREINRLFIAMLRSAKFDARVAELTTRDENFFRRSFPDSFQLNSEVTAVVAHDGSIQFYDPGTPFCPADVLSWEKQAVQALVYGKRDWRFVETPVAEAVHNCEDRKLLLTPQADGQVGVQVELKRTGQRAIELRNELIDLPSDEQRRRIISEVREVVPAAAVDEASVTVSNMANANLPLAASLKYTVPQLAVRTERRLLVRPASLSHPDQGLLPALRRWNGVYFNYPWSEVERVAIKTPDGFTLEQLPDPVSEDIGAASYQAAFTRDGGQVLYERRLVVNGISFSVEQYQTIKAFFDRVHQADNAGVVFKQSDVSSH